MTLVWDRFPGSGSDLLCMLALADHANDDGDRIFPSVGTIAKRLRLSRRQAQRVIGFLIEQGWLSITKNEFGGKPGTTRHYSMNVQRLRQAPLFIESTGDADVTGDIGVTGDTGDIDGCHPRHRRVTPVSQTGDIAMSPNPSITIIEPSGNRKRARKRATALPDDFQVTATMLKWAEGFGLSRDRISAATDHFKDHHTAKGSTFKDWPAAWRTWIHREIKFNGRADKAATVADHNTAAAQEFLRRRGHAT